MDFVFRGQRIRESTGTHSLTIARTMERNRRKALEEGVAGVNISKPDSSLFRVAAEAYIDLKSPGWSIKSIQNRQDQLRALLPAFGKKMTFEIEARDIAKYQTQRLREGFAPNTIRNEVGFLASVMLRERQWERIKNDVEKIPEAPSPGRRVPRQEQEALLAACAMSHSRALLPFVTLVAETASRKGTVERVKWENVDFEAAQIQWGKDKTVGSSGRIVPLNQTALATLQAWAENFPHRRAEHYVFPSETCKRRRDGSYIVTKCDPTRFNQGLTDETYRTAKKRAMKMIDPDASDEAMIQCRLHDLRHTGVTKMLNAKVPLTKVVKIVGWTPATTVRMATVYGHFVTEDLREGVNALS